MNLSPTLRWALYGVALVGAIGAAIWVERDGADPAVVANAPERQDSPKTQPSSQTGTAADETREDSALGIDSLPTRSHHGASADPFSPRSWKQMAADAARRDAPPRPPPVPQPPPLPFSYMGKLVEGKVTTIFLTHDDENYIARLGDTINERYRVEEIGEDQMVLTYLPLKRRQHLAYETDATPRNKSTPRTRPNNEDEDDMQRTEEQSGARKSGVEREDEEQPRDADE